MAKVKITPAQNTILREMIANNRLIIYNTYISKKAFFSQKETGEPYIKLTVLYGLENSKLISEFFRDQWNRHYTVTDLALELLK